MSCESFRGSVAQHATAGKRVVQMQLDDLALHPKVRSQDRRLVEMGCAAADAQSLHLLLDGKIVHGIDHRLALSNPDLLSAPSEHHSLAPGRRPWREASLRPSILEPE
jgi:hypothetical protein